MSVVVDVSSSSRAQQTASDPSLSVWVAANAGTGKTKVLTDRVLRLLLRGVRPSRILCITYTKAAAAEMQNRIHSTLIGWVEMEQDALRARLSALTGEPATDRLLKRARTLFARVLEAPEGVRILTIHSFCQSILRRFPLEAGVAPHFEVIDERTKDELLSEARHRLLASATRGDEPELSAALEVLAGRMAESRMQELFAVLVSQRAEFDAALAQNGDSHLRIISRIAEELDVDLSSSKEVLVHDVASSFSSYDSALRIAISELERGAKGDVALAAGLARWCEAGVANRAAMWGDFTALWLTQKGEPRKVPSKAVAQENTALVDVIARVQSQVMAAEERLRARALAELTASCITVSSALFSYYSELKRVHSLMDYDDLVLEALRLFRREGVAQWVLYKLDGGLDHLLIDEAQDTGPAQWELVELLVGEFFAGMGTHEGVPTPRTLFVVGDEKQSIYGFQGAAPKSFGVKREEFARKAAQAGLDFAAVPLGLSYRSTAAVLQAVDAVFNQPHVRSGVTYSGGEEIAHGAFREGQAGRVEVWPLVESQEREQYDLFSPAKTTVHQQDTKSAVAERIAKTIREWLDSGERLESADRPVTAGDILILVRKRADFVPAMVRALKRLDVPVAGADRLELVEHIAVMDLLALAEFLLLPEDDLSLACLLKSPLCNVTEEELFTLAYDRGRATLWSRVQEAGHPAGEFLSRLLKAVDYERPYELFARVLEEEGARARFAARLGEESFDPLDEFLSLALQYEQGHAPSLQGFLQWMRTGRVEIKRDMEQGQDAVRIMTVHGAKGLQAPIVFLPDTTAKAAGGSGVSKPYWIKRDGKPLMLWSPSMAEDVAITAELRAERKREEEEEFRRLLYVAMTRASDRLYICGWLGKREKPEDSWYGWMDSALKPLGTPCELPFGEEGYYLDCAQTAEPKRQTRTTETAEVGAPPAHLFRPPAPEPFPPQPLVPSRGDDLIASAAVGLKEQKLLLSPASDEEALRFRRGNLVHRLLQFLPDVPEAEREAAALRYFARFAPEEETSAHQASATEVLAVLNHAGLAPVFGAGSLAEVPLTGLVAGADGREHILSGQVDRLCVTPEGIWVVDYKTGKHPPARAEDAPPAYLRQMALYRAALRRIYPALPIHSFLLWTNGPLLMPLPDALLDAVEIHPAVRS